MSQIASPRQEFQNGVSEQVLAKCLASCGQHVHYLATVGNFLKFSGLFKMAHMAHNWNSF